MKNRNLLSVVTGSLVLISICGCCPLLIFSSTARHALYTALGQTGSATLVYEQADLVVVPFPIDPARPTEGTTYQAVGVLLPHLNGYELKSLATEASVVLEQNEPLAVSQDRAYLQVGDQQMRLSDWTLVENEERDWELLREDVDTMMDGVPSKTDQVSFSIRKNSAGIPYLEGNWRIDIYDWQQVVKPLYYGLGCVQQAGWGPDQQTIYIANDDRILTVSLDQEAI